MGADLRLYTFAGGGVTSVTSVNGWVQAAAISGLFCVGFN
jgi:hypothetical protein